MTTTIRHRVTTRLALRGRRPASRHAAGPCLARPADQAALRRDLQVFRSPAELTDLAAILRQYPDEQTAAIRDAVDFTRAS